MEATTTELKIPTRDEIKARLWEIATNRTLDAPAQLQALEQLLAEGGLHENAGERERYRDTAHRIALEANGPLVTTPL